MRLYIYIYIYIYIYLPLVYSSMQCTVANKVYYFPWHSHQYNLLTQLLASTRSTEANPLNSMAHGKQLL